MDVLLMVLRCGTIDIDLQYVSFKVIAFSNLPAIIPRTHVSLILVMK